jgi:hypothetical protein
MTDRILVGSRKGLFTVRRGREKRWAIDRADFLGDHVSLTGHDPRSGALFAAFQHGHFGAKLHRSTDGGLTWHESAKPLYPEKPAGEVDNDPMRGTPIPWSVERVWELVAAGPASPGLLWLGTIPGGMFRSRDGGDSWELVRPLWDLPERKRWVGGGADLPGLHSICVHPHDDAHLLVAVSCGGVWESTDGGASWGCHNTGMVARYMPPELQLDPIVQDPHRMVQCRSRPEHLWIQHHNGIFRSTDGARTWMEVTTATPSCFGFGVVVHPRDPDTAWFVPAHKDEKRLPLDGRLVVTRTRDGGSTFQELRKGLPQLHAYDLTYRHALDIDESGDCLAFGTTTGSLYVSNDGGDMWQCVGEHLPPIDCVRFA